MTQAATRIPLDEAEPTTRAMTTDVARRRKGRVGQERINWSTTILLALASLTVLIPLYVTISMSLKSTSQAVDGNAFSLPAPFSTEAI